MAEDENYAQYRARLIEEYYNNQLETLMSGFRPDHKTVILLPGGMGSQLQRTEQAYPALPNVPDDVIWLDFGIAWDDGLKLEIDDEGKDIDAYVVAAHGPIRFWNQRPYDRLWDRALEKGWNYGVFGFDWRRPLKESSANLRSFILRFRDRVRNELGTDPIPGLTILGHSMGGIVATHALRDEEFSGLGFNAVMTIATPFYGTSTQQERYFIGDKSLKELYEAEDVVRIIASLPGPYTLMLLSKTVYDRDHQKIGLAHYPQRDPSGNVCDPFDDALRARWLKVVRDHWRYIEDAKNEMNEIAAPINANIASNFFNVRSALDKETAVELIWDDISGDTIDPETGPSPLTGLKGPGDGTVPAWSAFHAYCENRNRYDLTQTQNTEHAYLLNHDEVLTLVENVVTTGKLSAARLKARKIGREAGGGGPAVLSPPALHAAVTNWVAESRGKLVPPPPAPEVQRTLVASLIGGTKPRMADTSTITTDQRVKRARERKPGRSD